MRKLILTAVAAAGLLVPLAAATGAQASVHPNSTIGCQATPYCGSQELYDGSTFVWAVAGPAKSGAAIVTQHHSGSRSDQDFSMKNLNGLSGSGGLDKRFQYAPNGDNSGFCISDINNLSYTKLVLRPCNNSVFQQFSPVYYDGTAVAWESRQSNQNAIQNPGYGGTGTQLNVAPYNGDDNQLWEYTA